MSGIKRTPADRRFSMEIRLRDRGMCQRCFSTPDPRGLHSAHMFSRRCGVCTKNWRKTHYCTRLDPDNAMALCYGCHQHVDSHPVEKEELFRLRLGDEAFDALRLRAHGVVSPAFLKRWLEEREAV